MTPADVERWKAEAEVYRGGWKMVLARAEAAERRVEELRKRVAQLEMELGKRHDVELERIAGKRIGLLEAATAPNRDFNPQGD